MATYRIGDVFQSGNGYSFLAQVGLGRVSMICLSYANRYSDDVSDGYGNIKAGIPVEDIFSITEDELINICGRADRSLVRVNRAVTVEPKKLTDFDSKIQGRIDKLEKQFIKQCKLASDTDDKYKAGLHSGKASVAIVTAWQLRKDFVGDVRTLETYRQSVINIDEHLMPNYFDRYLEGRTMKIGVDTG